MEEANQQSQSPQPVNSMPPAVNSGKSKVIPIILGVAVVVLIAIGAYVLGSKQSQPVVQNIIQTTPIPSPNPADETANWKTYTNTKYGYSFKYPSNYTPYDFSNSTFTPKDNSQRITLAFSQLPRPWDGPLPYALDIMATDNTYLDAIKAELESAAKRGPCSGCPKKYTSQIDGKPATVYDGYAVPSEMTPLEKIFILEYSGKSFSITRATGEDHPVYPYDISDQILSTFKFTNPIIPPQVSVTPVDTTNWKTYTNTKYKFLTMAPASMEHTFKENIEKNPLGTKSLDRESFFTMPQDHYSGYQGPNLAIDIFPEKGNETWVEENASGGDIISDFTVAGIKLKKLYWPGNVRIGPLKQNGYVYKFEVFGQQGEQDEEAYFGNIYQILSTFQFSN